MTTDLAQNGTLIESQRGPGSNHNLYQQGKVPIYHVDGIADLMSGPALCQLKLYRTDNIDFDNMHDGLALEQRILCLNVMVPTVQLIEIATNILKHFKDNHEELLENIERRKLTADALLSSIEFDNVKK